MPLRIVHYNDPILRQKGGKITVFDAKLGQLADDMVAAMNTADGIGLAAQQVGLALQLCVVDLASAKRNFTWLLDGVATPLELIMPMALVNPSITVQPSDKLPYEEGCLSFPGIRGDVIRPDLITVAFQDLHGIAHSMTCDGLLARCIQHEVDHLNGVLFIDRMDKKLRQSLDPEIKELAALTRASEP
jgi:peptide deformylase